MSKISCRNEYENGLPDEHSVCSHFIEEREKTAAYVVDENLKIIYVNDEMKRICPDFQYGEYCYKVICGASDQCINCPLKKENQGKAVVFSKLHHEYVSVSSAEIAYSGTGKNQIVLMNCMSDKEKASFYNTIYESDYDELLEMNYLQDTYKVFYHSGRKESSAGTTGKISTMVRYVAERVIHPDDRQRFYEFWALDRIGKEVAPKVLMKSKQGRFRRLPGRWQL